MDDENLLVSLVDERLVALHLIVRLKIQRPDRSNRIVSECLIKPWLNRPLSHPAQIHSTRLRRATIPRKFPTKFQRIFAFFISLEEEMTNDGIIASGIEERKRKSEEEKRRSESSYPFVMQRVKRPRGFPPPQKSFAGLSFNSTLAS